MGNKTSTKDHWLGIDLGGTKILAEVFDADWNCVGAKKRKTKAELGQDEGIERLLKTGHQALEDADIDPDRLAGVGIGCPGVLNLDTGVLVRANNLDWTDVPVRALLQEAFNAPTEVLNDVDAGTFGEAVHGAGKGERTVLGVFPGTGIGGGLVYEGKIYRGRNWSCMEIGHIQVQPHGPRCGCGREGCLEAVAGRLAISTAASAAVLRGQAPWLAENVGSDPVNIRSSALADAVENGDDVIEALIRQACGALGSILGGVVNLLAPDVVVIGGGLAEAMPKLYRKSVLKAMTPKVMDALQDCTRLEIATLGDRAVTQGTAAWVRQTVEKA